MPRHSIRREVERILAQQDQPNWDRRVEYGSLTLTSSASSGPVFTHQPVTGLVGDFDVQGLRIHHANFTMSAVLDSTDSKSHAAIALATFRQTSALVPETSAEIKAAIDRRDAGVRHHRIVPMLATDKTQIPVRTGISAKALANLTQAERLTFFVIAYNLGSNDSVLVSWTYKWTERRTIGDKSD